MVYQWLINNLSCWLPQACYLCGQPNRHQALCPACFRDLPRLAARCCCPQCGRPLATPDLPCGHCLRDAPAYDRVISGFAYANPISQLVGKLKFQGRIQLARLFGELLLERAADTDSTAQAILPVPLHSRRLRQRGFNQALEIARPLARGLHLPILSDAILRQRDTLPQSSQTATRRRHNVRGAFSLLRVPPYRRLAIVDDVMTSGHTVNEIAQLLRQAGVERIEIWCVARAWGSEIKNGI